MLFVILTDKWLKANPAYVVLVQKCLWCIVSAKCMLQSGVLSHKLSAYVQI